MPWIPIWWTKEHGKRRRRRIDHLSHRAFCGEAPALWDACGHRHFKLSYKKILFPPDVFMFRFVIL